VPPAGKHPVIVDIGRACLGICARAPRLVEHHHGANPQKYFPACNGCSGPSGIFVDRKRTNLPNATGLVDICVRLIGQWLSERLGQQFVIENRAGAGSNIATEFVVKAPPDGYTLLLVSPVNAWNTAIYDNLKFNSISDIAPVASIIRTPGVMEVTSSLPTKTVPEFIAYAKANPGKIMMATGGPGGGGQHVYGELFKVMTGVDLVTVHYCGAGPALPELMSGRVQVMFDPVASSIGYIRAGKLRALGVTTATRALPDIPPIGDFVPGYEASGWDGIGAPARTAPRYHLNSQQGTPADFGKFIGEYIEKWGKVIRACSDRLPERWSAGAGV